MFSAFCTMPSRRTAIPVHASFLFVCLLVAAPLSPVAYGQGGSITLRHLLNGMPVKVTTTITVNFLLK